MAVQARYTAQEEWRPVPGFDGLYEVSSLGRVRGIRRRGTKGGLLACSALNKGYRLVTLRRNDPADRSRYLHHVVAEVFLGPRPSGAVVRHLDGDPLNNAAANLQYGTVAENNADMVRHGRHANGQKTSCPSGHEYTPENTYRAPGRSNRLCRTCRAARDAARTKKGSS